MTDSTPTNELGTVIARTTQAIQVVGEDDRVPWLFARCWMHAIRYEALGWSPTDIDSALADFDALPAQLPGRAKLASVLATSLLRSGTLLGSPRMARAVALADVADTDLSPLPDWPVTSAALRAGDLLVAWQESRPGFRPRAALRDLERYAEIVGDTQPHLTLVRAARLGLRHLVAQEDRSVVESEQVSRDARALLDGLGPESPLQGHGTVIALMQEAHTKILRSDVQGAMELIGQLREAAHRMDPGDPLRSSVEQAVNSLVPFLEMLRPGGAGTAGRRTEPVQPPADSHFRVLEEMANQPGLPDTERALRLSQLATAELAADTPQRVDNAVRHLTEVLSITSEHDPRRPHYLLTAGSAHLRRVETSGSPHDLRTGTELLEKAQKLAESTTHGLWTTIAMPLAHAYRLSGRRELCRSTALRGLRGHAWSVLLESSPDEMQAVARHAADDALDTARWCLMDNDAEGAATALDAGRGLILYATTETRDVVARLTASGDAALAREWQQAKKTHAPGEEPGELRRRVVGALAGIQLMDDGSPAASPAEGTTRLLDPPAPPETRAALRSLGADALVYLLPGAERNGAAVVVPADAPASWMLLPQLNDAGIAAFDAFLSDAAQGMAGRDAPTRDGRLRDARVKAPRALNGICEWAWEAAVGPLLERHLTLPEGRPARLVLIPVGELARVPWHAACTRCEDGSRRYAMEDVVFSYAPSARLLCESAWRSPVSLTGGGLVIGDPDPAGAARDLPAARLEALAVKDRFYPDARYIGRMPDGAPSPEGAGTREEVLRWLADPDGGPMLHLACHGIVEESTAAGDSSYLLLDGGEHLAAERLVRTLGEGPDREIALAVLAACSTGRSGRGLDEAFSLSTTLLAGRVRSVVSANWSVPDAATSVLMFMFHHFLREAGMPPADALREAQLCMVGRRRPPQEMPSRLRGHFRTQEESDIASWAAFVHTGR
ncbi:CHAT domain-containing protein [Streptomyces sp. NPDC007905]|uniref:CHAT domain-containing protein n=1 Tax=Streptomyces sp. NPDC007905 TaxID=3364788 RepID=UPI0036EB4B9E